MALAFTLLPFVTMTSLKPKSEEKFGSILSSQNGYSSLQNHLRFAMIIFQPEDFVRIFRFAWPKQTILSKLKSDKGAHIRIISTVMMNIAIVINSRVFDKNIPRNKIYIRVIRWFTATHDYRAIYKCYSVQIDRNYRKDLTCMQHMKASKQNADYLA